ncbi:unnamed protein product, partial [Discosporangium mesarthrocarpum]
MILPGGSNRSALAATGLASIVLADRLFLGWASAFVSPTGPISLVKSRTNDPIRPSYHLTEGARKAVLALEMIRKDDGGSELESRMWHWRNGWEVHYELARGPEAAPSVVLVPGFGVGTFHFHRNMAELSKTHKVYALDLLGQGKSWPTRVPRREDQLCYGVDLWTEQVLHFIQEVVGEPAFIVGNSLGGYLAVNLAANHPEWCRGLALLNATPFWAFRNPPETASPPPAPAPAATALGEVSVKAGAPSSRVATGEVLGLGLGLENPEEKGWFGDTMDNRQAGAGAGG